MDDEEEEAQTPVVRESPPSEELLLTSSPSASNDKGDSTATATVDVEDAVTLPASTLPASTQDLDTSLDEMKPRDNNSIEVDAADKTVPVTVQSQSELESSQTTTMNVLQDQETKRPLETEIEASEKIPRLDPEDDVELTPSPLLPPDSVVEL